MILISVLSWYWVQKALSWVQMLFLLSLLLGSGYLVLCWCSWSIWSCGFCIVRCMDALYLMLSSLNGISCWWCYLFTLMYCWLPCQKSFVQDIWTFFYVFISIPWMNAPVFISLPCFLLLQLCSITLNQESWYLHLHQYFYFPWLFLLFSVCVLYAV